MKNAYFLSHNGLGDNITNIGAVLYLTQFYDTVFLLCKDKYESNVKLLFANKRVVTVPFDSLSEKMECRRILAASTDDRFISGCHKLYARSRITQAIPPLESPSIDLKYPHITQFYTDIGLTPAVYVNYFDIESTEQSRRLYTDIQQYNIVFLHTQGSNRRIDVDVSKYERDPAYILICANKTLYDPSHPLYAIAARYTNVPVAHYIDIIKHANIIHVIDSCFSCIVYPLSLAGKLRASECIIHDVHP
jgi:hypothetical protein